MLGFSNIQKKPCSCRGMDAIRMDGNNREPLDGQKQEQYG